MTKKIVAVLAALLINMGTYLDIGIALAKPIPVATDAAVNPHNPNRLKRFWFGAKNNHELAQILRTYFARDPMGQSLIDPTKCTTPGDGSCASGQSFFTGILAYHPDAMVNGQRLVDAGITALPDYIDSLQMQAAPSGAYWMECMVHGDSPSGWIPRTQCLPRRFKPGEMAYVDPNSHQPVLAQECDNPVGQPQHLRGCAYKKFWVKEDDVVLMAGSGPTDVSKDECAGLKMPGEDVFVAADVERCEHAFCSLIRQVNANAVAPLQWQGSVRAEQSGWAILRGPLEEVQDSSHYQTYICIHRVGVRLWAVEINWYDYLRRTDLELPPGAQYVAIVYPDDAAALVAGRLTRVSTWKSVLWWDDMPTDFLQDPTQSAEDPVNSPSLKPGP